MTPDEKEFVASLAKEKGYATEPVPLLEIEDSGVKVSLEKQDQSYILSVVVSLNSVTAYRRDQFEIELTHGELVAFLSDLQQGNRSSHGESSFFLANKITIKENKMPVQFRDVRLVYRVAVFFKIVSATFSQKIMSELLALDLN